MEGARFHCFHITQLGISGTLILVTLLFNKTRNRFERITDKIPFSIFLAKYYPLQCKNDEN